MPRIATAIVLFAVFFAALYSSSPLIFVGFCAVLILIAGWEWSAFVNMGGQYQRSLYVVFVTAVLVTMACLTGIVNPSGQEGVHHNYLLNIFYLAAIFWAFMLLLLFTYPRSQQLLKRRWLLCLLGLVLLSAAWAALLYLRNQDHGRFWVIYIIAVVACADMGAYFVGKLFGRRKLAVSVSPGKSWEGFFGGLVTSQLFAVALWVYFSSADTSPLPGFNMWLLVTTLLAAVSVLGDLSESMLKRNCGLKDSGSILPGHGGVLDRIDGLISALPIFALIFMSQGY